MVEGGGMVESGGRRKGIARPFKWSYFRVKWIEI